MENLSIGAISAWQQQQTAMQIGIAVLKKSMHLQAEGALALLQTVTPATSAAPTAITPSNGSIGQRIDVVA